MENNEIIKVLINRDGMTPEEAHAELKRVQEEFNPLADDPETVLREEEFGLEPDYIFDLLL